jgi:hypothetical protein
MPTYSGLLVRGGRYIYANITDYSKTFSLVPHVQLLTKLTAMGVVSGVDVWES